MPRKNRRYYLYSRCDAGHEPMRFVTTDTKQKMRVPKYGYRRGVFIRDFSAYQDMKDWVRQFVQPLGMSEARAWQDWFDWSGEG